MAPFDDRNAGKRRQVYQMKMASTYLYQNMSPEDRKDEIGVVTHIVTPFGTFGACGVHGTHKTVESARKVLKAKLKELLADAKKSRRSAIERAEEKWADAQKQIGPRILLADSIEPEETDE